MTLPEPLLYRDDLEQWDASEIETVNDLRASLDEIMQTTHKVYGRAVRGLHAKGHAVLMGNFTVEPDLPPELAQGLFATPGTHSAYVRISTSPGDILDDAIALPRGFALKVLGVEGERMSGSAGTSQDFLMINGPAFAVPTAKDFASSMALLAKTTERAEGAKVAISKTIQFVNHSLEKAGFESHVLAGLGGAPQVQPLGETYHSAVPIRYGQYVAKFRLRPISPELKALTGQEVDTTDRRDAIREDVREQMGRMNAEWAFEVQLARDLEKQPIEDASAVWSEEDAPFAQVATLTVESQDSWSPESVQEIDVALNYSPWNGLAAHRPLGNVNRARKEVYEHSSSFRSSANGCPFHRP